MLVVVLPATAQDDVLAPDDQVAFVRSGDLWIVRGDGSGLRQLTRTSGVAEMKPVASPDGSAIAYEVYETQGARPEYSVWVTTPDGLRSEPILSGAQNPAWSPDGGRLLFTSQRGGSLDIWLATRRGTDILRVLDTPENEYRPCWSPHGDRIAFIREVREGGQQRYLIVVRDPNGSEQEIVSFLGRRISTLSWAPSEQILFTAYRAGQQRSEALYTVDPGGSSPRELSSARGEETFGTWGYGPAGYVYVEADNDRQQLMVRALDQPAQRVRNTQEGDSDPTVVPGPERRAPWIYIQGQRSFYLPTPLVRGKQVLLPLPDLARQLGWSPQVDEESETVVLTAQQQQVVVSGRTQTVEANGVRVPLEPPLELVGGTRMVPIASLAEALGVRFEWRPETRILRVYGAEAGGTVP